MSYLNCLPFPNRNSDSGVLYIVFKRFHLIFPVAHLDSDVEARFMHPLSNLAYASRIASRIAYHPCIILFELCMWLIVSLLLVCLDWVEPGDEFANEEPVVLSRIQSTLTTVQARWSYPRNHYYLCYASLLALFAIPMLRCLPFSLKPPKNCHVKPVTHHVLANRWLAMLPLCSAPLIALLVVGEDWRPFLVGTSFIYLLGYYYIAMLS